MRKRTIGILLGMAVLAFASGRVSTAIDSVYAAEESDTSDDEEDEDEEEEDDSYTKELEQKRNNALDQIKSLKSDISTVESKIKELKNSKSNLQSYINQLDGQMNTLSSQIKKLEDDIAATEDDIAARTEELEKAEADAQDQYEMMKTRICYLYENGNPSMLAAFLEADSMADMINRVEYARQVSEYDQRMMQKLSDTMQDIKEQKEALEEEKQEQEDLLSEVQAQKQAVNKAMDAKTAIRSRSIPLPANRANMKSSLTNRKSCWHRWRIRLQRRQLPKRRPVMETEEAPVSCGHVQPVIGSPVHLVIVRRRLQEHPPIIKELILEHHRALPL